jgi:hypothetical protein
MVLQSLIAALRILLVISIAIMPVGPARAQTVLAADAVIKAQNTSALVNQAAYMMLATVSDSDGDGYFEPPAMSNIGASGTPLAGSGVGAGAGGFISPSTGAPTVDGYGVVMGYCAFDNGSIRSGANLIAGSSTPASSNIVYAVISAGADGVIQTTCANAYANSPQGDDVMMTISQAQAAMGTGGSASAYWWGNPVATTTALNALNGSSLATNQIRLVTSNNTLWTWNGSSWVQVSGGGSSGWTLNGTTLYSNNGGPVGIGVIAPSAAAQLQVGGGNVYIGTGNFEGGTGAAATSNRIVFDNTYGVGTANKLVLYNDASTIAGFGVPAAGQLAGYSNGDTTFSTGATGQAGAGTVQFRIRASDGAVVATNSVQAAAFGINGTTVIDASRNMVANSVTATSGTFTTLNVGANAVWHAGNFTPASKLDVAGGTITGALTVNGGIVTNGLTNTGNETIAGTLSVTGASTFGGLVTVNNGLVVNSGAMVANGVSVAPTWNNGATAYNGLLVNVTNTASAAGSRLLNLQMGGATKFAVDTTGTVTNGVWAGSTVGVAYGGTGLTAVPAGALIYGAGTSPLNTLATGGANTVLMSNGAAPYWAASTGTGNVVLANSPTFTGTVSGAAASWSGTNSATAFIPTGSTVPSSGMYLPSANTLALATNSTPRLVVDSSGRLLLGFTSSQPPDSLLQVSGDGYFSGNLSVGGTATVTGAATFNGTATFNGIVTLNASAIEGGACSGNTYATDGSNNLLRCFNGAWQLVNVNDTVSMVHSGNTAVANNNSYVIATFSNTMVNTGTSFTAAPATGVITINRPGTYSIQFSSGLLMSPGGYSIGGGNSFIENGLAVNYVISTYAVTQAPITNTAGTITSSMVRTLNAGDTIVAFNLFSGLSGYTAQTLPQMTLTVTRVR